MYRPFARPTALLAALLFLFSWTGEALGMHACPHHAAVPGARMAMGSGDAASSADAAHGGHHGEDHGSAPAEHGGHQGCTCSGSCPSAPADAPPSPGAGLIAIAAASEAVTARADAAIRTLHLPFVLPYGQAPPLQG